ncbi:MAG: DUF4279 domain-containing protein [Planctomycetota bacterium]
MPECVLRVAGATFPVDEFLAESTLEPCAVFHVGGESLVRSRPASARNGFFVSTGEGNDLQGQIDRTIEFLKANRTELLRLKALDGIEWFALGFAIHRRDVLAQYDKFSRELIALAAEFGLSIELNQYAVKTRIKKRSKKKATGKQRENSSRWATQRLRRDLRRWPALFDTSLRGCHHAIAVFGLRLSDRNLPMIFKELPGAGLLQRGFHG